MRVRDGGVEWTVIPLLVAVDVEFAPFPASRGVRVEVLVLVPVLLVEVPLVVPAVVVFAVVDVCAATYL